MTHLLPALPRGGAFPQPGGRHLGPGLRDPAGPAPARAAPSPLWTSWRKSPPTAWRAIQALQPDLVLVDPNSSGAQSALEEAGVTVLSVEPATDRSDFERLYSQVSSALLGARPVMTKVSPPPRTSLSPWTTSTALCPRIPSPLACYLYDLDGSAVTGDMFGSTIMSYAGVTNVFESLEGGTYDFQSLEIANPNVIFCAPGLKEQIAKRQPFRGLPGRAAGQRGGDGREPDGGGRAAPLWRPPTKSARRPFPQLLESSSSVSDPTQDIESQVSSALEAQAQYETLEQGDQGDSVQALQERLTQLGYLTDPYDGMYGSTTADCVSRFQTANGLEASGIADPATQAALFASGALREDGTPLPEESGESSTSRAAAPLRKAAPPLRRAAPRKAPARPPLRAALRRAPARPPPPSKPALLPGYSDRKNRACRVFCRARPLAVPRRGSFGKWPLTGKIPLVYNEN